MDGTAGTTEVTTPEDVVVTDPVETPTENTPVEPSTETEEE